MRTNARIYVMQAADGSLKVGHSRNPELRLQQIPEAVDVLHQSGLVVDAELVERTAHRLLTLAGKHVRGEWFAVTLGEAIDAIERAERIAAGDESLMGRVYPSDGEMTREEALSTLVQCAGSQRHLAAVLGVSQEHISRWMRGHYPVPQWVIAMAEVMEKVPPKDWPDRWRKVA